MVDTITSNISSFEANQRAAEAAARESESSSERISSDYEDFLTLMTTQMKNQDPLKPIDSTDFVSQLAQFSGVEQQVNMNKKLDDLLVSFNTGQFDEAALYLGKYVTAPTGKFNTENGLAPIIEYSSPDDATSATLEISDKNGQFVKSIEVPIGAGRKTVSWDATDLAGDVVPDDLYRADLIFKNFRGDEISRNPAETKNRVNEVIKTETGFELKTQTGDLLSLNDVTRLADTAF